jgi:bifunctional DNA-binding transcriptional regulator/antitoxin component of YhaV-PrlF toxin-antitoxin module
MKTPVSSKGRIVLPGPIRRRLGVHASDALTGLPVLIAGADAPVLRSKEVEELLANFP